MVESCPIKVGAKVVKPLVPAYLGPKVSHFGQTFWDMDLKFVLPIISIFHWYLYIISGKPSWKSTVPYLSETFRIDVNIDFANTKPGGFFI